MRPGITTKLFLAVLATSILVAVAMGVAARVAFTRGFLGYLNEQGIERIENLVPEVAAAYAEHGNWEFLRDNPRQWFRLIRPRRPAADPATPEALPPLPEPDMVGVSLRVSLLDADKQWVIGNPGIAPDTPMRPIIVDGQTVGWLALVPFQTATAAAEVRFQQQQLVATWIIGVGAVLLAAAVSMVLARALLAPLKRIAQATDRLAAGDYATRVEATSGDEIGRLGEDFNRLALALEKNERMRRAFMADVSHELRTPLAVLRGELEAVEDGVRPSSAETMASLRLEVETLTKLVDDLYDLSLSDAGALAYRLEPVDLGTVLSAALDSFGERLAARRILVDRDIPDTPLPIRGDRGRLQQLFTNLLQNSLRYTDEGGRLRVRCQRDGARMVLDFMDSAPGVPQDTLAHLFERFYRVEGSRNRAHGGAGLGLAISRNIVEAHGGTIQALDSPLGGVWIAISLPTAAG